MKYIIVLSHVDVLTVRLHQAMGSTSRCVATWSMMVRRRRLLAVFSPTSFPGSLFFARWCTYFAIAFLLIKTHWSVFRMKRFSYVSIVGHSGNPRSGIVVSYQTKWARTYNHSIQSVLLHLSILRHFLGTPPNSSCTPCVPMFWNHWRVIFDNTEFAIVLYSLLSKVRINKYIPVYNFKWYCLYFTSLEIPSNLSLLCRRSLCLSYSPSPLS